MVNVRGLKKKFRRTVGHVRFFCERDAHALFARNGLTVINSMYTCLDYDADYRIKSPLRRMLLQPVRKHVFRRFPRLAARLLGNVSLLVLLRKTL